MDDLVEMEQVEESKPVSAETLILQSNPSLRLKTVARADYSFTWLDTDKVRAYLQHMLRLRYQHVPFANREDYCSRSIIHNVTPLAAYVKWRTWRDRDAGEQLADSLDLHPVELDQCLGSQFENLLVGLGVDVQWVKARLRDSDNIWQWVYQYNQLANNAEWDRLARQFFYDREVFEKIFPGDIIYANDEYGIPESNRKAQVHVGMIELQGHFFSRIDSPTQFRLSKAAKKMNKAYRKERKRSERELQESREEERRLYEIAIYKRARRASQERAPTHSFSPSLGPGTMAKLKDWAQRTRHNLMLRHQAKSYLELLREDE
ncbi:MAG: hypothetical protein Q9219_001929 [cf. Caloplaca sp. 3 TL-2023]